MGFFHFTHMVHQAMENMPKLKTHKDPTVAAVVGLLFGPFGIGLYFRSWADFVVLLLLIIILGIMIPGVGAIGAWIFAAIWGYARASH